MTSQELIDEIQSVFQAVFKDPTLKVSRAMTAEDVEGWDSFAHVNLIMAMELKFRVKFKLAELQELNCVGDMMDMVERKVGVAG